jgi:hypothetical protein
MDIGFAANCLAKARNTSGCENLIVRAPKRRAMMQFVAVRRNSLQQASIATPTVSVRVKRPRHQSAVAVSLLLKEPFHEKTHIVGQYPWRRVGQQLVERLWRRKR